MEAKPIAEVGRYLLYEELASGGMATVHLGRLVGPVGFSRTVAIKRLHPQFAKDEDGVAMFLDEARLAARIQHPNVVQTLDVVQTPGELLLVMEFVRGETLSRLLKASARLGERIPPSIAVAIIVGALHGLHAAHEARSERGEPLNLVHRDVSPQNIMVGADGTARVLDFGVAKAIGRMQTTSEGQIKGKLGYMPPEQLSAGQIDRRTDIYAAAVVLWEALVGQRLFGGDSQGVVVGKILHGEVLAPGKLVEGIPPALDAIVLRGLARAPEERYATAREMAMELERSVGVAPQSVVGEWVERLAGSVLRTRDALVSSVERASPAVPEIPTRLDNPSAPKIAVTPLPTSHPTPFAAQSSRVSPTVRRSLAPLAAAVVLLVLGAGILWARRSGEVVAAPPKKEVIPSSSTTSLPPTPTASTLNQDIIEPSPSTLPPS
ncbi:MAG: protein kinase, partial [Polyangiaceae bacterium]|nr:protein kinase [Polyangiaceae bacterium]